MGPYSVLCLRLTELEEFQPLIQEVNSENGRSHHLVLWPHHLIWAEVQALLNLLSTTDERWLVINKANEEAQCLHQENPNGTPKPIAGAIPFTGPDWNPNGGGLAFLEHYRKCILRGLKKGVPKQQILNVIQALQQKTNEAPSEFLGRTYEACGEHTVADPQPPENVWMVNMTSISQSAPDVRRNLQQ